MNHLGDYDVIVIGAGHAGIEAAHAAAMLGAKTAVFTMSLDAIGNMPCNPSIGGTAKGTLVRELDALGGVMGLAADATYLQSRMLNKGKGPAVHALRVQTDRKRYHEYMKHALELTPGLAIHQAEIISIEVEDGHVKGVVTQLNGEYGAKCVVIATGTNLGGKIFVGDAWYASGPDGMHAANALTESLKAAGLPLRRFKTGTPARVHRRSIDFSKLECQPGDPDNELQPFSFMTDALVLLAQTLGLNTCWAGLSYRRVDEAYSVGNDEKLTCMIALGYGATQGHKRKSKTAEQVSNISSDSPEWFRKGVEAVLMAPTAINQQKFSFTLLPQDQGTGEKPKVLAKRGFSMVGYTKMDLGIARLHFEIGAGTENFDWA